MVASYAGLVSWRGSAAEWRRSEKKCGTGARNVACTRYSVFP